MKKLLCLLLLMPFFLTGCTEVQYGSHLFKSWQGPDPHAGNTRTQQGTFKVGKPYKVMGRTYYPAETYNYVETGIASWYGPGFHGGKTASGERYDQNELTAAHRTLQMPSLVRVTNLDNGRAVVVRVNDRGPFAKGRIIDVSGKAAKLLGMVGTGTARVKLELLENESRALASAARSGQSTKGMEVAYNETGRLPISYQAPRGPVMSDMPSTESELASAAQADSVPGHVQNGRFYPNPVVTQKPVTKTSLYVQAGAFGVESNALRLSQKLAEIAPARVESGTYNGKILYKVRLGPLDSVRSADNVLSRVLAKGQSDAIIVVQ